MKNSLENIDKFCSCLELWKGCILAGIFAMSTSIFDLLWSVTQMIDEENVYFFYLLFALGIESVLFIAITGLLFVAIVKKSKFLLMPWLIMASVDVIFSLVVAFAELALPTNLNTTSCSMPVLSTLITVMICILMIYCGLIVFAQYVAFSHINAGVTEIKVTPASYNSSSVLSGKGTTDVGMNNTDNTLQVPKIATPKDAW